MPPYTDKQYETDSPSGYTETGYYPSPSVYDPKLSADQWIEILHDEELTPPETLAMLLGILALGGESTCARLAREYGNSAQYYNSQGMNFGRRVKKRYGLPDCMDGDTNRLFPIPFLGRYVSEYGTTHYSWKLRDELKKALLIFEKPSTKKTEKASLMEKNLILYGPPGTGKTYETINTALEILQPDNIPLSRKEQKKSFDEWKAKGHIGFVTFHQSFSYEDFVEGIRAETAQDENGLNYIRYTIASGIFKRFCSHHNKVNGENSAFVSDALSSAEDIKALSISADAQVWKISLPGFGADSVRQECFDDNHIRIGYDSYGKHIEKTSLYAAKPGQKIVNDFIHRMKVGDIVISCISRNEADAIGIITGEYEWIDKFKEFKRSRNVYWISKNINFDIKSYNNNIPINPATIHLLHNITHEKIRAILSKVKTELLTPPRVLIIDEINRGNIAGIFGELITLIEPSKRLGEEEELTVRLPYSREEFGVPSNLYIIGTMNTADRSLTGLDIALRRRFHFRYMPPRPDLLEGKMLGNSGVSVGRVLDIMNQRIEALLDKDHCIGHAPFMHLPEGAVPVEDLAAVFRGTVIPLLEEYFFEDWEKIRLVLNDHRKEKSLQFIQGVDLDEHLFGDVQGLSSRKTWHLNENAFQHLNAFIGVIDAEIRYQTPNASTTNTSSNTIENDDSGILDVSFENYVIRKYPNNTIEVFQNGEKMPVTRPELRKIAAKLGIELLNGTGTEANTRRSGQLIIDHLLENKP